MLKGLPSFVDVIGGEEADGEIDHFPRFGDDDGLTPEAGQPVSLTAVVAFERHGFSLGLEQPVRRDDLGVGLPVVGAKEADPPSPQPTPQPSQRGRVTTTAAFPIKKASTLTAERFPDPEFTGFFFK